MRGKAKLKQNRDFPDPISHMILKDNTQVPAYLTVLQPNGRTALIPTIEVTESLEELGFFFSPAGDVMHHQT